MKGKISFLKDWWLAIIIIAISFIIYNNGKIFDLLPPMQIVIKKISLVTIWYFLTYIFRRIRLGKIKWSENDKKTYYYILLIGSAIIFAFS